MLEDNSAPGKQPAASPNASPEKNVSSPKQLAAVFSQDGCVFAFFGGFAFCFALLAVLCCFFTERNPTGLSAAFANYAAYYYFLWGAIPAIVVGSLVTVAIACHSMKAAGVVTAGLVSAAIVMLVLAAL